MVKDPVWLALIRHLGNHRWQTLLSILGITLGVAIVVAVDLANQSVRQSFSRSMEQITGAATHQLIGGPDGIDERFYTEARLDYGLDNSAPVIEGTIKFSGQSFTLLGLDPLAEFPFRTFSNMTSITGAAKLLTESGSVLMSAISAGKLDVKAADRVTVKAAGVNKEMVIAGLFGKPDDPSLESLLVADIATAQEIFEKFGRIDRIDLILSEADQKRLTAKLPPDIRLVVPENRSQAVADLSKSFQTNLTAMSLLALLVGGFLIYNATSFSVLQRRRLLGMLRMIGVTRQQLFLRILSEALLLGLIGTLFGLLGGILLGQGLVKLVARTVNDLYFNSSITELLIQPSMLYKGLLLGIVTTLIATIIPALEAAGSRPQAAARRSVSEQRTYNALPWLVVGGVFAIGLGIYCIQLPDRSLLPGFSGLFFLITGFCLGVPAMVLGLCYLTTPALQRIFGFTGLFAGRGISASLSRTGLAIAALTMAIAATIGMGIMVESFRSTVENWLTQSLKGDLYLSIPHSSSRRVATPLPEGLIDRLTAMNNIEALSTGRRVEVEAESGPVDLLAIEMAAPSYTSFVFSDDPPPDLWQRFHLGEVILISEPYAFHQNVSVGDKVGLYTAEGLRPYTIGGIFSDYGSDRGILVMDRQIYADNWNDVSISSIGVYLRDSESPNHPFTKIRALALEYDPRIRARSNKDILGFTMNVFDRTFTITRVLRLLVIIVAFVGILSALMALQFERARENAVLRASGFTRLDLIKLTTLQTSLMGLFAGLLALPLGWLISQVLIYVINLRAFGWTLNPEFNANIYWEALLLALGAAILAGIYPGYKMSRTLPAEALREE